MPMSSPPTPPSRASHAASLPAGGEEEASALRVASRIRRRTNSTRRAQNKRSEESSPASTAWCAARHVRVRLHARASPAAVCTAPQNNAARRAKGRGARKKRTKEAAAPSAAESSHRLPSAPTAADAVAQSAPLQPITARGGSLRHAARAATARVSPGRRRARAVCHPLCAPRGSPTRTLRHRPRRRSTELQRKALCRVPRRPLSHQGWRGASPIPTALLAPRRSLRASPTTTRRCARCTSWRSGRSAPTTGRCGGGWGTTRRGAQAWRRGC